MNENSEPNPKVKQELYRTLVLLGADNGLLGTVGSWGDSLSDEDVLANLQGWNEATLRQLTQRIEHCGTSSHHPSRNQGEAARMSLEERKAS